MGRWGFIYTKYCGLVGGERVREEAGGRVGRGSE